MGGYHVRVYRAAHPAKVAAMLLVDSSHEDQARGFEHTVEEESPPGKFAHLKSQLGMRVGLSRLLHQCGWTWPFLPAALSTHGRRIVAEGSGHYIQIQRPDLVINAIQELAAMVHRESALGH